MEQKFLRCKIVNDLDFLENLNKLTNWTPGRGCIRPSPEAIEEKRNLLNNACSRYDSIKSYVLHRIFKISASSKGGFSSSKLVCDDLSGIRRTKQDREEGKERLLKFVENLFPYALPEGTHHWVLWLMKTRLSMI